VNSLRAFAKAGGPIIGICNGFQILTEMGLLPGALTRNAHLRFECRDVHVRCEGDGVFTRGIPKGKVLRLPIAHADGRYHCDQDTFGRLEGDGLIAFRYCDADGTVAATFPTNPTAPSPILPAFTTPNAMSLVSCPTPNAPAKPSLATPTGCTSSTPCARTSRGPHERAHCHAR
jgi:phosphoribosylformylglycinamidine (FGAM) synthase-like amidotransferase family enzyme